MAKAKPEWKEFEGLVERLQRAFHKNAVVAGNDRIMGQDSGRSREIDVSIRYKLGTTDLLLVVDCKKRSRIVDLTGMHAFIGLKEDVRAHAGMIVSDKGFSKGARKLAKNANVELFTLQDTRKSDWQCRVTVPLFVEEWLLVPKVFRRIHKDGTKTDITDDRTIEIIDFHTGKEMFAADVFKQIWEKHPDKKPGDVSYEFSVGEGDILDEKMQVCFSAQLCRYTRSASLALVGLRRVSDGLTYTDQMKIQTSAEPEIVHPTAGEFPMGKGWPIGVMIRTTLVKTIQLQRSGLDLKKNHIEFCLDATAKPMAICLPEKP